MRKTTLLPSFAVASALVGTLALCPMTATAQDTGDLVRDDAAIVATGVESDATAAGGLSLTEPGSGDTVSEEPPAAEDSSSGEVLLEGDANSIPNETPSSQPSGVVAGDNGSEVPGVGDEELPEKDVEGDGPEVSGSLDVADDSTDEPMRDDVVLDSDRDPESASDVTPTEEPGEEPSEGPSDDAKDEPAEGLDEDTEVESGTDAEVEPVEDVEGTEDADDAEDEPTVDLEDVLASLGEGTEGLGSGVSQVMDESFSSAADAAAQKAEAAEAAEAAQKAEEAAEAGEKDPEVQQVGTVKLHRLYNPYTGEHLYSTSTAERDALKKAGWKYEGTAWVAPEASPNPVYRLYNPHVLGGDHFYTTDRHEYDVLCSLGWLGESLAWYGAPQSDGTALFRLYNPYATTGTHHFTSSAAERLNMVSAGWRYEGLAWFGVDMGPVVPTTAKKGWVDKDGARFYGNGDGTYATGWKTINKTRYHFDNKGRLSTGVVDVDGKIYYFDSKGKAKTGWQKLSGYRYYFESSGTPKACGWWNNGGKRYYLKPASGAAATGWQTISNERYYFESTGSLHFGWLTIGGNTYYFDPSTGIMATGRRTIDGLIRNFTSTGICTKTGYQVMWKGLSLSSQNVVLPSYAQGSYWSYVHPCTISADATRAECIEAFINAAYDYQRAGTPWVDNNCGRPGTTVDCSGLVMQGLYACGMSLTGAAGGDYNPYSKYYWNHHFANTWRNNQTFQPITVGQLERGDIIYYQGHVAIYLGNGRILESTPYASNVREASMYSPGAILGCARPFTK